MGTQESLNGTFLKKGLHPNSPVQYGKIPLDIVHEIIANYCESRDLPSLALVNDVFQEVSEQLWYRSLSMCVGRL